MDNNASLPKLLLCLFFVNQSANMSCSNWEWFFFSDKPRKKTAAIPMEVAARDQTIQFVCILSWKKKPLSRRTAALHISDGSKYKPGSLAGWMCTKKRDQTVICAEKEEKPGFLLQNGGNGSK